MKIRISEEVDALIHTEIDIINDFNEPEEEYASIGKSSGVEKEIEEVIEHPFDAEKISVNSAPVPLNRLLERLAAKTISAPEIQRRDDLWDVVKKSRLIESLMLKIPLPLFYVAADLDENWKIVDGLQRVSTIRQFMVDKSFKLKDLEFLTDFNGFSLEKLPMKYRNRISDSMFQFAVISATTPQEVQRNIFKRLNTGGLPLTQQEVRHALYYDKNTNDFLLELISSKEFCSATTNSVNDSRMAARELVLRFISFLVRDHYLYPKSSDMDEYLSDTMQLMNAMPELDHRVLEKSFYKRNVNTNLKITSFDEIRPLFILGMKRAKRLFGIHAFRKSTSHSAKRAPINKSIFECVAIILSQMDANRFAYLQTYKSMLINYIDESYKYDYFLRDAISRDSQKYSAVQARFEWFYETLVAREYGGEND
jgi:hypothetical protein